MNDFGDAAANQVSIASLKVDRKMVSQSGNSPSGSYKTEQAITFMDYLVPAYRFRNSGKV
jgi:hypothetical protein